MIFAAHQSRHDGTDFSFEGSDEAAGVLGKFNSNGVPPVATAHTLKELERDVRAYLGTEPAAILYLTDGDYRVHRIMINEKYHAAIEKAERRAAASIVVLVLCFTCLVGVGSFGSWALLIFLIAVGLYALILRARLFNVIEGAIVCEILLFLAMLIIPALQRVRDSAAERVGQLDPQSPVAQSVAVMIGCPIVDRGPVTLVGHSN